MRIIVAITGASGATFGVEALKRLQGVQGVETLLVISEWGKKTIEIETEYSVEQVEALADRVFDSSDVGAAIASGSFRYEGMLIVPCSMKTLSAIANGYSETLVARAADVTLKERRKLVLAVRETPLSAIHLENMLKLSRAGAVIMPISPSYYHKPQSISDMQAQFTGRLLNQLGIYSSGEKEWSGIDAQ